ncbi:proline--tRNA ligase [Arcobacter sp. FWKO B]|uniref:proline--tRNA ligase n=1 Tax=Arcobacter sp. FWKO B TaxID=2593672 RepID=UPI0018A4A08B|nr:proline--tRNA ligase [Arcobacter sp. FWKO B]QOG11951.1 proline--tRNA ligase [Arcobacter sp. FWKO B]
MKFSKMFIPTTKEMPKDATLPSHQYLVRAGFINQVGAGIYNFMPLGKIVLEKIRNIVKSELDEAGCNEVQLGFVTPIELWEQSGRASKMGLEMLRIKDRKNGEFVLSPTNEEAMVELVKNRVTSYKDLPINLYQINTKFRDEGRPRFGLLRGREFLMKDGYSFHENEEDMIREFHLMEETYKKIFTKLGLDFRVVEADSGAIGGTGSKEFHVLANSGEDTIVVCKSCEYGANIEAASRQPKEVKGKKEKTKEKVLTPDVTSIEDVAKFLDVEASQTIKAVIKKAVYEETQKVVVFFVRGDDELEETKATNAVNALELIDASEDDIKDAGLVAGYVGVFDLPKEVVFVIDNELQNEDNLICGSNEENYHLTGVDLKELENAKYDDLVAVQAGDKCKCCGGELIHTKGIEVGHIFQLGTKYSAAMNANFLDRNGKAKPFVMGTYGIGVSRLIAAVIEQHHDEKGMLWTKETAPFMVDIIVSNAKNSDELSFAEKLYNGLSKYKIDTILDDRVDARYGFKMGDFELIGFPYGVIIGKKLSDGIVEIVDRKTNTKTEVKKEDVVSKLLELID